MWTSLILDFKDVERMHDVGKVISVSVSFVQVHVQTDPRWVKTNSNIPSPGKARSVKRATPGPTITIKSPPHALPDMLVQCVSSMATEKKGKRNDSISCPLLALAALPSSLFACLELLMYLFQRLVHCERSNLSDIFV